VEEWVSYLADVDTLELIVVGINSRSRVITKILFADSVTDQLMLLLLAVARPHPASRE
jgi:hypothetical protein